MSAVGVGVDMVVGHGLSCELYGCLADGRVVSFVIGEACVCSDETAIAVYARGLYTRRSLYVVGVMGRVRC